MVFRDLCFGAFDGGALGNHLGDRLSRKAMRQRIGWAVSRGILLSAVTVALATFTKSCGEKTGAHVIDAGQTGGELITSISECLQGKSHRSLLSDRHYNLSDTERKPRANPIRLPREFSRRAPVEEGQIDRQKCGL